MAAHGEHGGARPCATDTCRVYDQLLIRHRPDRTVDAARELRRARAAHTLTDRGSRRNVRQARPGPGTHAASHSSLTRAQTRPCAVSRNSFPPGPDPTWLDVACALATVLHTSASAATVHTLSAAGTGLGVRRRLLIRISVHHFPVPSSLFH